MGQRGWAGVGRLGAALVVLLGLGLAGGPGAQAQTGTWADSAFAALWARTDSIVANGTVARGWLWGPGPGQARLEPWAQAPGGQRLVQYFDKARMEISNPAGDRSSEFFVTTGLLTIDMVRGSVQVGEQQYQPFKACQVVVAGDDTDATAPTYTSFRPVLSDNGSNRAAKNLGSAATGSLNRAGQVGTNTKHTGDAQTALIAYNDVYGHNIPRAFWDYINAAGNVVENGQLVTVRPLTNWIFTIGYPVTEPYWVSVKVGGKTTDVLVQLFQRRALTYIPGYAPAWQVQMTNAGAHYYRWLYNDAVVQNPTRVPATLPPNPPVPPTAVPPTRIPPTAVPPTAVPPTAVPPTAVPPTAAPVPLDPQVPGSIDGSVAPIAGPVGTNFRVDVAGFAPGEQISWWFTDPAFRVIPATYFLQADTLGKVFGVGVDTTGYASGVWAVTFQGLSSGHKSVVYFRVGPIPPPAPPPPAPPPPTPPPAPPTAITTGNTPVPVPNTQGVRVTPGEGNAGTTFTITGTGYRPGEGAAVIFMDPRGRTWVAAGGRSYGVDGNGRVSLQVVPSNVFYEVVRGTWQVSIAGISSSLRQSTSFVIR